MDQHSTTVLSMKPVEMLHTCLCEALNTRKPPCESVIKSQVWGILVYIVSLRTVYINDSCQVRNYRQQTKAEREKTAAT
jgi:hypothetical protein